MDRLPKDVWPLIVKNLYYNSIIDLAKVDRQMYNLIKLDEFWELLTKEKYKNYGLDVWRPLLKHWSWKKLFQAYEQFDHFMKNKKMIEFIRKQVEKDPSTTIKFQNDYNEQFETDGFQLIITYSIKPKKSDLPNIMNDYDSTRFGRQNQFSFLFY